MHQKLKLPKAVKNWPVSAWPPTKATATPHGEKVTETTWHNLVAWGKVAEIAEKYLTKGKEDGH